MPSKKVATEEQEAIVKEKGTEFEVQERQSLEEAAGLVTIETGNTSQVRSLISVSDDDKELITSALNVLADVIERKISDSSTKRYLVLLLVFIKSALITI